MVEQERTTAEAEEELGVRLGKTLFVRRKLGVGVLCFLGAEEAIAGVEIPEQSVNVTKPEKTVCWKALEVVYEVVLRVSERHQKPGAEAVAARWELQEQAVLSLAVLTGQTVRLVFSCFRNLIDTGRSHWLQYRYLPQPSSTSGFHQQIDPLTAARTECLQHHHHLGPYRYYFALDLLLPRGQEALNRQGV